MSNWKTEIFRATDLVSKIKDRSIKVPQSKGIGVETESERKAHRFN